MEKADVASSKRSNDNNNDKNNNSNNTLVILLSDITTLLSKQHGNGKDSKLVVKCSSVVEQLLQALSGADLNFIRRQEYHSDLKETLRKILHHIQNDSKGNFITRRFMLTNTRKSQFLHEIQDVADGICGRIFMSYAQRRSQKHKVTSQF